MNMNRMNLDQIVEFFENERMNATADFFRSCANDSVTEDGWIDADFVKRHVYMGVGFTWRDLQSKVTTIMDYETVTN